MILRILSWHIWGSFILSKARENMLTAGIDGSDKLTESFSTCPTYIADIHPNWVKTSSAKLASSMRNLEKKQVKIIVSKASIWFRLHTIRKYYTSLQPCRSDTLKIFYTFYATWFNATVFDYRFSIRKETITKCMYYFVQACTLFAMPIFT